MRLSTLVLLPAAAAASSLLKRCSPIRDPELNHGYLPPAPCWQTFNTACQPFLSTENEMTLDVKHGLAIIFGLSDSCKADVEEELAREKDGRKTYGWTQKHGTLTVIEGKQRLLVISGMTQEAVDRYAGLTFMNQG